MKTQEKNVKKQNVFQETLNLPQTSFPMRAHAQEKEPELIDYWRREKIDEHTMQRGQGQEGFFLYDGPPYANGHIHLGTTLNKILKDILLKSKRMKGFYVPYIPGWDCHGLPIEFKMLAEDKVGQNNVEQKSIEKQTSTERIAFKKRCRDYVNQWIGIQREEFKNLGVLGDWENYYATMAPTYEGAILEALSLFFEKGFIERKNKSVPWCFHCQTVLAVAEIEYKQRKDPSCYILFPLPLDEAQKLFPILYEKQTSLKLNLLVWTTTPWTIPLNRAVAINPEATYVVLKGKEDGSGFIVARERAEAICKLLGIKLEELAEVDARAFDGLHAQHPLIEELQVPIIRDSLASTEDGTACVHISPGCGPEDYLLGLRNNLEIFSPLSAEGTYLVGIKPEELIGKKVTEGQGWVIKKLEEHGMLMHKESIEHSYPHCWRCRQGLIFRATRQWFCNLQKDNLVGRAVEEISSINFVPETGKERLESFVGNRAEWCISRQRAWGVPIPAIICNKCEGAHTSGSFIGKVAEKVKTQGIEYWDSLNSIDDLLKEQIVTIADVHCEFCHNQDHEAFTLERDILDVWFDAGLSHYAVTRQRAELDKPADVYFEGSDQHRGWFQSALLTSMVVHNKAPMKTIITHGYVVDKNKHKMSKSLGNVVAPAEVIKKYSRDITRLWVASSNYERDIVVSDVFFDNVAENYRKLRNTCRFILSNLYDFTLSEHGIPVEEMYCLDKYILRKLYSVNEEILKCYNEYNFTQVVQILVNFCVNDLSGIYLDIAKDRLYVERAESKKRRSTQTALYHIIDCLTRLMAPVLSFLAEEVSSAYLGTNKQESIHLMRFTQPPRLEDKNNEIPLHHQASGEGAMRQLQRQSTWQLLEHLREIVLKGLEEQRVKGVIKHSLEARVTVSLNMQRDEAKVIMNFRKDLGLHEDENRFFMDWFIVSQVIFDVYHENDQNDETSGLIEHPAPWVKVVAEHALGVKCPRCWQWDELDQRSRFCAHCYYEPEYKQATLTIECHCTSPAAPEDALCRRCRRVLEK